MRRLFALFVLCLLVGGGLYFWRLQRNSAIPRDLGTVGARMRDAKLAAKVKAALSLNDRLKGCRIETIIEGDAVTLQGRVPDDGLGRRAEEIVSAVPGVRRVVNHLRVSDTAEAAPSLDGRTIGETLDDRTLEVRVHLAFSLNRNIEGGNIDVAAFRKQVTLSGEVASMAQRQAAVRLAREVVGVAGVSDRLRVRNAASPAVEAQRTLQANPNLSRYDLRVRQDGDRLVVSGRVRTGAERDLAGLLVRSAAAAEVDNQVEVR